MLHVADDSLAYPATRRVDHVDTYFGVKVADPYRWLEADVRHSPEVADWVAAENKLTDAYLDAIPQRETIRRRLTELWNFAQYSPHMQGRRAILLSQERRPAEPGRALRDGLAGRPAAACCFDPNTVVEGRHDRPGRTGLQRRRQATWPTPRRGRLRLVHLARHGDRHRQAAARRTEVDQVLQRLVDQGRQGLLLQPLRGAEDRAPSSRR